MSADFSRTLRSLNDRRRWRRVAITLLVLLLVSGWGAWFVVASVTVYEVTDEARIETEQASRRVQSSLGGLIVENRVQLGQSVKQGDLLARLDDQDVRLALATLDKQHTGLLARTKQLNREIDAERAAMAAMEKSVAAEITEQQTRITAAKATAESARRKVERLKTLINQKAVSKTEYEQAVADAEVANAKVSGAEATIAVIRANGEAARGDRLAKLASLESDRRDLLEQAATLATKRHQQQYEINRREIRAPASGRIGQVGDFPVGSTLESGDVLAAIVPQGVPRVVAAFPAQAMGRLSVGQTARLKLQAFPWLQHGSLAARVMSVGNELRDGKARVELELTETTVTNIPIQHGLAGSIEVEVDRVSPLKLVLQTLGRAQ